MLKILVGMYRSRHDADHAHRRLLERGFDHSKIGVAGVHAADAPPANGSAHAAPATEEHGLAAFIERMFSGLMPDAADHERYARALRTGGALVGVHGLDDAAAARAKPILSEHGTVDEHVHEPVSGERR